MGVGLWCNLTPLLIEPNGASRKLMYFQAKQKNMCLKCNGKHKGMGLGCNLTPHLKVIKESYKYIDILKIPYLTPR